jgi:hypothetical protein
MKNEAGSAAAGTKGTASEQRKAPAAATPSLASPTPDAAHATRRQLLLGAVPAGIVLAAGCSERSALTALTGGVATTAPARKPVALARVIEGIYPAPPLHWVGNGFHVAGYFSAIPEAARKLDPFVLLDYHPEKHYAPSVTPRGVGVHPHRGFETVTFAFQGSVAHHDSTGAGGIIGPGDVQWMTAAAGILHKEYHEASFARAGGVFQMAQLWVNLPRAHKMAPARYQPVAASSMGRVTLGGDAGTVRVIAGEYDGVKGPAKTFTSMHIYDVALRAGGRIEFAFPAAETAAFVVMKGSVEINGSREAEQHDFVLFRNEGQDVALRAGGGGARLLVLRGEPIGEPIVQHGPFVMNTQREIRQAIEDFENGQFGALAD